MKNSNKTIYSRIIYGIKSGWNMPYLPDHINKLNNNIYIKILKILGSLSIILMLSGIAKQFDKIIYYSIFIISLFYIGYKYLIVFYSIKQWFYHLKNGDFIVKNSPTDLLSTILKTGFSTSISKYKNIVETMECDFLKLKVMFENIVDQILAIIFI